MKKVSVIIPVYNAEPYIQAAVQSALEQPEVGEVILIEDGSPDNSLSICQQLTLEHKNVRLLQHPEGTNRGPSASRNLGIKNALSEYVAFLDADDLYLPGRFSKTLQILDTSPEIDGVYEALGTFYENESSKNLFQSTSLEEVRTLNEGIPPEELFAQFMLGETGGGFSFDGFTGRLALFEREALFFDEEISLREDTLLMYQLSAKVRLVGGELKKPVVLRRVHPNNRVTHHFADQRAAYLSNLILYDKLFSWAKQHLEIEQITFAFARYLNHVKTMDRLKNYNLRDRFFSRILIAKILLTNLPILFHKSFWNVLRSKQMLKRVIKKR